MRNDWPRMVGVLLVAPATGAAAVQVSGVGGLLVTEHRVDVGSGIERGLGAVASVGLAVDLPPRLSLVLHARAGALAAQSPAAIDRDFGELALTARWRATSWLGAEAGVLTRSYSAVLGRQRWILVRTGGEIRTPLAWGRSEGVFRLGYLPVVRVPGLEAPRLAFVAGAGMEYVVGRLRVRGLYELERYDFTPAGAARRLEQLSAVSVLVSVRLRRAA